MNRNKPTYKKQPLSKKQNNMSLGITAIVYRIEYVEKYGDTIVHTEQTHKVKTKKGTIKKTISYKIIISREVYQTLSSPLIRGAYFFVQGYPQIFPFYGINRNQLLIKLWAHKIAFIRNPSRNILAALDNECQTQEVKRIIKQKWEEENAYCREGMEHFYQLLTIQ